MKEVYILYWDECCKKGDGLWCNNGKLAIHWPTFSNNFKVNKEFSKKVIDSFYYNYNYNNLNVMPIKFNYFRINDIATNNNVWNYCSKIIVYYEKN